MQEQQPIRAQRCSNVKSVKDFLLSSVRAESLTSGMGMLRTSLLFLLLQPALSLVVRQNQTSLHAQSKGWSFQSHCSLAGITGAPLEASFKINLETLWVVKGL